MAQKDEKKKHLISDLAELAIETGAPILGEVFAESVVGLVIPAVATTTLSIRQKIADKRLSKLIADLTTRISRIETALSAAPIEVVNFAKDPLFPIILERTVVEMQDEKIGIIANGFENTIMSHNTNVDEVLSLYDVLADLRVMDIRLLMRLHKIGESPAPIEFADPDILDSVKEPLVIYSSTKLERMGLVGVTKTWDSFGGDLEFRPEHTSISTFGHKFVEFFRSRPIEEVLKK